MPSTAAAFAVAFQQKKLVPDWLWDHRRLVFLYFCATLIMGPLLGLFRGALALNQPIRNILLDIGLFKGFLSKIGIHSFLQEEPVWYGVETKTKRRADVRASQDEGKAAQYQAVLETIARLQNSP
jgi:hypothetical protein